MSFFIGAGTISSNLKKKIGLFIFRRDLRIEDNVGLKEIMNICDIVYPCFIFTPEQVGKQNKYKSNESVQFMIESLIELDESIGKFKKSGISAELYCFYGKNNSIITNLIDTLDINIVGFNKDYSPYAIDRDQEINKICEKKRIDCYMWDDYYLYTPGSILNESKKIYSKFTPFYNKAIKIDVIKPRNTTTSWGNKFGHIHNRKSRENRILIDDAFKKFIHGKLNNNIIVHGGRHAGLAKLKESSRTQHNYEKTRNTMSINTSILSPYLKFGCISVREVYYYFLNHFGKGSEIMRQLLWREFYAHVLYGFPEMIDFNSRYFNTHRDYDKPKWKNNKDWFDKWCKGETGYPIVDACMRQLNTTGWMHNRGRLITSCFLVKTLLIDWKWGEEYFAQHLVDYDVAMNNGNWQWISSTGVDSMPYFRIFNPWTQSKDYDADAKFIKKWIPELEDVDPIDLHEWNTEYVKYKGKVNYMKPMVDYSIQRKLMVKMYE